MLLQASGEHKQRILLQIAVDGIKIRDEKSGVSILESLAHIQNVFA
jgi:hypothetical protein